MEKKTFRENMDGKSRKEKISNFWYYYKTHVIVGILAIIVIIVSASECANRVDADLGVVYMGSAVVDYSQFDAAKLLLEDAMPDVNGDGQKSIILTNITLGNADPQQEMAMRQKAMTVYLDVYNRIFLMDAEELKTQAAQDVFVDLAQYVEPKALEGGYVHEGKTVAIKVENNPILMRAGFPKEDLYIALRDVFESDKKEENIDNLVECARVVLKLINEEAEQ